MANEDVSIFQEIDEALRVENMEKLLRRYGKTLIAGMVGIILVTAASVIWKNYQREHNVTNTSILMQAQELADSGKYQDAAQKFAEAEHGRGGVAAIAKLRHAQMLMKMGDREKALKLYQEIATSRSTDEAIKDLSTLDADVISSNKNLPEKNSGSDLQSVSAKGHPFAPMALELSALRMQNAGKHKEAHDLLAGMIDDPYLPLSERERIMELLDLHGEKK